MFLTGCLTAGTHGSIKGYRYPISKQALQNTVEKVIAEGGSVHRDTIVNYIIDETGGKHDTLWDNQYNDTINYVTIYVQKGGTEYKYTFRYYGDKEDWDTAKTSEIFIAYAWDENKHQGGSEGNGGVTWYTPFLKKRLVGVFETEFIDRVDKQLAQKHTDDNE
jgi:hypothetical protein